MRNLLIANIYLKNKFNRPTQRDLSFSSDLTTEIEDKLPQELLPDLSSALFDSVNFFYREREEKMNIFRLAGDMTHLASVLVLLLKIHTIKSCAGMHFQISLFFLSNLLRKIEIKRFGVCGWNAPIYCI